MDGTLLIAAGTVCLSSAIMLLLLQITYWKPFTLLGDKALLALHAKLTSYLHSKIGPMLISREESWRHPMSQALRVVYYREKLNGRIPQCYAMDFWELHTAMHKLETKLVNTSCLKPNNF